MSERPGESPNDSLNRIASELGEWVIGGVEEIDADAPNRAARVQDPDAREHLGFAARAFEKHRDKFVETDENGREPADAPAEDFWQTGYAQDRVDRYEAEAVAQAARRGNQSLMEFTTGWPEYESDVSGLNTTRKLENWLCNSENCKLIYLAGLMGRGKTDWSLSMLDTVRWHYQRIREEIAEFGGSPADVPEPEFAANFAVDPAPDDVECLLIQNYDDLVEWGERGSSDDTRWFVFDEASTELTAQSGENAQDVAEMFAPFVKKMRKMGINMIVVGHDRGDVHVAIRSLADFVAKPGQKKAQVYAGVRKRSPVGHMFDLTNIPETAWDFSTDDMAEWSWGEAAQDDEFAGFSDKDVKRLTALHAAEVYEETNLSMSDACEVVSKSGVSVSTTMLQNAQDGEYDAVTA